MDGNIVHHVLARGTLTAFRYQDEIPRPIQRTHAVVVHPGFVQMHDSAIGLMWLEDIYKI